MIIELINSHRKREKHPFSTAFDRRIENKGEKKVQEIKKKKN